MENNNIVTIKKENKVAKALLPYESKKKNFLFYAGAIICGFVYGLVFDTVSNKMAKKKNIVS